MAPQNPTTTYEKSDFSVATMPDLTGKVAVVTGGNTGIGYETCLALASKGAQVFMASRSSERAAAAIAKIAAETGKTVEFLELNLQDLKQVQGAAQAFLAKKLPLDILVNNAVLYLIRASWHVHSRSPRTASRRSLARIMSDTL
jgi:NAD(P)-dependent dehydrogenase (short-subunit alcohol dehydrogenase family)